MLTTDVRERCDSSGSSQVKRIQTSTQCFRTENTTRMTSMLAWRLRRLMRTPMEQGQSLVMTTQRHRSRTTMQCPWRRVFIARLAPSRASNSGFYVRCLLATRTAKAINSYSYSPRIQHLSQWLVTNPTRLQARRHLASRSWLVQGRPLRLLQERLQEFLVASPHLRFVEGGLLHPVKHVTVAATHTRQPPATNCTAPQKEVLTNCRHSDQATS